MDELDLTGATVLSVQPGDQVVLVLKRARITAQDADEFKQKLEERLPGVTWTVVGGVDGVIHVPASATDPRAPL